MSEVTPMERYVVPGLQRGLQVLAQFTHTTRELTGAELSRRMGLPRASVFRLLQTLEQMGFVERVGDSGSYKLGLAVLRLGFEFLASMELTEHGRPVLDDLCVATGLSSHLVVRDGSEVVFVVKAAGRTSLFNAIQVGARLPAHATVLGRILLADLSLSDLRELYPNPNLQAFTSQTPTTVARLKQMIDEDRNRGFGISNSGFEVGISTIAAPVFDDRDKVVAAVSLTVTANSVQADKVEGLVAQVRAAAAKLSQRIHHLPLIAAKPSPHLEKMFA